MRPRRRIARALGLARREALWALQALRDEPLPLFAAAAAREAETVPEIQETAITLRPMTGGGEVVEDYGHVGLTLRDHPVAFLRGDLRRGRIVACVDAMRARDGSRLTTAGLVLVRQMPGSAKGVLFITIEDETGSANIVVWPSLFEQQRRVILGASMLAIHGRIQREGEVVHLIAHRLHDLSGLLAGLGAREAACPRAPGHGDEIQHGSPALDPHDLPPRGLRQSTIRVKARNFH